MKKQLLTLFLLAFCASTFAIGINQKTASTIKNGKIIIGLYEHEKKESAEEAKEIDDINTVLTSIIKQYWTFSEIADVMPLKAAQKAAKKDPNLFVLYPGTNSVRGGNAGGYRIVTKSDALLLSTGSKDFLNAIDFPNIPTGINKASLVFAVTSMQNMVEQIYNKQKMGLTSIYLSMNDNIPSLKSKTLLIPDYLLDEDVTSEMFGENYPFNFKIVSTEEYSQKVLEKDSSYCYLVYLIQPAGSSFAHMLYWIDAANGAFSAKLRISSAVQIKGSAFFKNGKSKTINKRILKDIAKLFKDSGK